MEGSISWVGIDAHKKTLAIAVLAARGAPEEFTIANDERSIRKLVRRLDRGAGGRALIPAKPGDRIKTDRRDARKLAELYRAGVLTSVSPPTPEQEAIRDLCRCREDVRADLGRCRHRLVKMLVRRGFVFNSTSRLWSEAHRRWLAGVVFENEVDRTVMTEYMLAIEQAERRLRAMDAQLEKAAQLPLYREHVAWLRCFRGIDTIIAMIFVAELHGIERFQSPRELAAYLGLVPTLYASGESASRGGITKTGNQHIRRALIQAAWQYRHRTRVGPKLRARQQGQPGRVVTIADEAQRRLTGRYQRLVARGKMPTKVVVAIVRELVGFLWAA